MAKKIIYDIDDVLWGLNARMTERLGLDYDMITDVDYGCTNFSETDTARIFRAYEDASIFTDMDFYPGIERLLDVEQYGVEVHINSCACSDAVVRQKRQELSRVLPKLCSERLNIYSIAGQQKHAKRIDQSTLVFIDDGPHNIAHSEAKYNIMPRKPWNMSESAQRFYGRAKGEVIVVDSLIETIEKVEEIVKRELNADLQSL